MSSPSEAFAVWVDDNFHYMDEDERYLKGRYATYASALEVCVTMMEEELQSYFKAGMTASELYGQYTSFGADPWISGVLPPGVEKFSAWNYARRRAAEICGGEVSAE